MRMGRVDAGRQLERLFGSGAVGGLSDAELLDRFAAGDEASAGSAFEAIVARHGPMVLRVCRTILRDAHAAEDAFQATFLVLARRAEAVGDRERLGNWLYGVALRTSRKARIAEARRAARERVGASRRPEAVAGPSSDDRDDERGRILHEEIGRLPGTYQAAVVACYLEGLTHAQAASRLRLAESTVRGRLARARKLLGQRLSRRGVAPALGLLAMEDAAEAATSATAARLPEAVVRSLARDALRFARSAGPATNGAFPSTAAALADGVLSTMWLPSMKTVAIAAALAAVGLGLTVAAAGARGRPTAEPGVATGTAPAPTLDPRPAAEAPAPGPQDPAAERPKSSRKTTKAGPSVAVPPDLARQVPGPIVRAVPVSKDLMVLSYMPDWNLGHVDNIGIGNNGCRTLIEWPRIPDEEANAPDRHFVIALYARKTASNPPSGPLVACEILDGWGEQTSWKTRPTYDPEPFATYKFEPGAGWKLFDITALVRAQAKEDRDRHGVVLRFLSEDIPEQACSTYFFVSREGTGDWSNRRPVLLIVQETRSEKAAVK